MKVGKKKLKKKSFYFLGYLLEIIKKKSGDLEFFIFYLEMWQIWAIFSIKNPLYRSKSYFSG
jgi:hypothetical protein